MQVYDFPRYYEIAFSYRDIPAEADFIDGVICRYSRTPVKSILELACGNSPHVQEFCKRGYRYVGLELNDGMIAYSLEKIRRDNLSAEIVKGNMIDFSLPEPVDCVVVFLGSFYIRSDEDLTNHFASVANVVRAGGLYILDAGVSYFPEDIRTHTWSEQKEGIRIHVSYEPRWQDKGKQLLDTTIILDIEDKGQIRQIRHTETRKIYSRQNFLSAIECSGQWEYVSSCSDFNIHAKPQKGRRNITILRRRRHAMPSQC
jgi:hypothetical protein